MFFPIMHPRIRRKNKKKKFTQAFVVSEALTCRLYQNQACAWLHLTQALITGEPIALGFTYPFKGPLYRSLPTSDGTRFGYLGP